QKAFVGYNVFLNGAEVASEVTTTEHMFTDLPHGTHTAGVQSVYTSGVSEIVTIDFNVEEILPIITFNVDMTNAPGFNPLQHNVYLTGNFTGWSEPGTGGSILMTRVVKEKTKINFFENFENYGDFTTELAPWINIDVHGNNTWGSTDFDFEGETQPFGWKIMNPGLTTPPINNTHPAHSGSKYLFSVASNPIPPGNEENKWLISPPLVVTAELNLSFYAKSITHAYGVERMRVYISTGGSDIDDFVMISSSPYLEIPLQWTEYTFSLEAWAGQTIRFAVENVSVDAFMLFLDSFSVTHGEESDSLIYTASVAIDEGEAVYKYFSDAYGEGWWGGEWPGDPNRIIEVSQSMTINDTWGVYEGVLHTLSLNVFPPSSGSVSGQGQYPFGEEVTLSAFPNDGYSFNNWTDSHGNIINYNSSFVYSMPAGSITLTANFGPEDPNLQLVTFHVKDSSNNAIYNAQITVMPDDKTSDNMNSKSNPIILHTNYLGQASFNATSGDYSYLVEKTGYLDVTGNFSVESSFVNIQVIMPDDMQVYTVTFNLDMIYAAPGFDPDVHTIYLTGGMNGWIEPGTEGSIEMIHVDGTIFTAQMELQTGVYYYKYFSDANGEGWMGGEWAGIHDREFVLHNHMVINDIWGLYDDIFFDLSLQANPASSGSATGSGQYQAGEIANLQALASTGFIFLHWTDQEGNIVYEAADPQHTMYAGHHTLIANFTEETTEQYQLTLVALPEEGGQVTGSGYYYQGEQVTITAAPNQGYVFQNWRKNGNVIGTQAQMVYTMPAEHVTLTAHFYSEDNPLYTLTLQSQPQVGGTVAGAGDYLEGEEIMLSANPSEGYDFIRWLELGTGNVYTDAIFTYTMPDRDVTLVAYFDLVDFVQQHGSHNLKLFPNPAQSNVTISCRETINKIEITDITGKLVYRTIPQDTEILVSLAGWENGIYIV
ncbi:MAG: T9SS C-terminal target domain-containing protein, partial [Bacteroidetes bacterium]